MECEYCGVKALADHKDGCPELRVQKTDLQKQVEHLNVVLGICREEVSRSQTEEIETRIRAGVAEAKVRDYEDRINWHTNCGEHARLLNSSYLSHSTLEEIRSVLQDGDLSAAQANSAVLGLINRYFGSADQ